jgi:acyl-CoA thioester hydrolase
VTTYRLCLRVYYEDTDAGGIVYHARYLGFAERARTEALREAGVPHAELAAGHGLSFVVRRAEIDYLRPARLDEELVVVTGPWAMGGASVNVQQRFEVAGQAVAALGIRLACVRQTDGRPARIPDRWRAALGGKAEGF